LKLAKKVDAVGQKVKPKTVGEELGISSAKHQQGNQESQHLKL
jgi:hypothetical protein